MKSQSQKPAAKMDLATLRENVQRAESQARLVTEPDIKKQLVALAASYRRAIQAREGK
jgi:hypothetical protein